MRMTLGFAASAASVTEGSMTSVGTAASSVPALTMRKASNET